jgi:hypothetical protein
MGSEAQESNWEALSYEILSGIREWRLQHPKATLREIELALDERLAPLRARMLQDVALQSLATEGNNPASAERPVCALCGTPLVLRGKRARHLKTFGGQQLTLERSYAICPTCKKGLFPPR